MPWWCNHLVGIPGRIAALQLQRLTSWALVALVGVKYVFRPEASPKGLPRLSGYPFRASTFGIRFDIVPRQVGSIRRTWITNHEASYGSRESGSGPSLEI